MYTLVFTVFTTLRSADNTPYTIRAFSNNQTVITKIASYGGIITMGSTIGISILFPIIMGRTGDQCGRMDGDVCNLCYSAYLDWGSEI